MVAEARRRVPSLDTLLRSAPGRRASETFGRRLVKSALAVVLEEVRGGAARGLEPPPEEEILVRAIGVAADASHGLVRVINATGVVLHTGLGRAPLPLEAARAAAEASASYSDLEVDRATGRRRRRSARAETLLLAVTGAEDALVVNNGAAGVLLVLSALARDGDVLVSRGELIEIGGEFRIPDIMAASGARLVEVGTTNRTRIRDFRSALTDRTALLLKVHPSNYRIVGFTEQATLRELASLASSADVPFVFDLGSGLLEHTPGFPTDEPTAAEALAGGADVVVFSGDKLLGGPQAGIVLGRSALIARMRSHPLARAVRIDTMQVAALERVLSAHVADRAGEIPTWRMLLEPPEEVRHRAELLAKALEEDGGVRVVSCDGVVGGGSMPGRAIASFGVEVDVSEPPAMALRLRSGSPSVFCRVTDRGVALDLRTVAPEEIADLARAIRYARRGGDAGDGV